MTPEKRDQVSRWELDENERIRVNLAAFRTASEALEAHQVLFETRIRLEQTRRALLDAIFQDCVEFLEGSWVDSENNPGAGSSSAVKIITEAETFFIELSGGMELRFGEFLDEPIMSLLAEVTLDIDFVRGVMTLEMNGQLTLIKLGTVGSAAGRFILDTSGAVSSTPQLWGVMKIETNFITLLVSLLPKKKKKHSPYYT